MENFFVVEFSDGIELVPKNWLSENKEACFYPLFDKIRFNAAVRAKQVPDLNSPSWKMYDVIRVVTSAGIIYILVNNFDFLNG